jgi:hypothetical protein
MDDICPPPRVTQRSSERSPSRAYFGIPLRDRSCCHRRPRPPGRHDPPVEEVAGGAVAVGPFAIGAGAVMRAEPGDRPQQPTRWASHGQPPDKMRGRQSAAGAGRRHDLHTSVAAHTPARAHRPPHRRADEQAASDEPAMTISRITAFAARAWTTRALQSPRRP